MSGGVTWEQLALIVIVVGIAGGGVITVMLWLWGKLQGLSDKLSKEMSDRHHALSGRIDVMCKALEDKIDDETMALDRRLRDVELQLARLEGANALAALLRTMRVPGGQAPDAA